MPALKILVACGFAAYAVYTDKFHFAELRKYLTPRIIGVAIFAFSIQIFIGAYRLKLLLAPQKTYLSYFTSLRLTYLGAFFDVFMVTSVGGDAIKALYLAPLAPKGQKTAAVSCLLLDRLVGLLGLLTLTLIVSFTQLGLWRDPQIKPYMYGLSVVSTSLLLGTLLMMSRTFYNCWPVRTVVNFMPLKIKNTLDIVFSSFQVFQGHLFLLLGVWLLSLVTHTFGVLTGYVLATGFGSATALGPFFVAWLISNFVVSFLPFGGVGSGQVMFDTLFKMIAGIAQGAELATAMQVTIILSKSPGFVAWLISREQAPKEMPLA